jgi:hypothetical protein
MQSPNLSKLYPRWIVANALGELFGLGLTSLVGVGFFLYSGEPQGVAAVLLAFLVAVASGVIEASIVGWAQWRVMVPWFPGLRRADWWRGTLLGVLAAYVLGYMPSTLMSLGEAASGQPAAAEPPQWMILLFAAGLRFVGGGVLSFGQFAPLRASAPKRARLWIPGNMLAWMFGMPLIFWGIDAAQKGQPAWQSVLTLGGVLLAAGALVGAIHGLFLVKIAQAEAAAT